LARPPRPASRASKLGLASARHGDTNELVL
jgi:hypothetical protein